jgi:protease-4
VAQQRTQQGADRIGIIRIEGPIVGGSSTEGLFGSSIGADEILAYLHQAQHDPSIRAVVIRMNSPGGSAAASQEIGEEIKQLRKSGKPVVTSISDMGASGGYWIAATTDKILASPAAVTGSIGVIMQITRYEEFYEKLGIEVEIIKSGQHKDMGSPTEDTSQKEREILQAMVNDIYDQFVTVVAEGRDMDREKVLDIADGRILTGRQARDLGLIDEFGTFYDAADQAAVMAGLRRYRLVELGAATTLERLLRELGLSAAGGNSQAGLPPNMSFVKWLLYRPQPAQEPR